MIDVELLGPFLLPRRLRVEEVLRHSLSGAALASTLSTPSAVFYTDHKSADGMRLEPAAARSAIGVPVPSGCDPTVTVRVDARSVGVIRARCRVADLDQLRQVEEVLAAELNAFLPQWCEQFLAGMPGEQLADPPAEALPGGRLLWWHRILTGVPASDEPDSTRAYGVEAVLARGARACVGDGFTTLHGWTRPGEVFDGLESATIDWVVLDEINRELAGSLLGLTAEDHELPPYDRALELERRVSLLLLLRDEQSRYVAGCAGKVVQAARVAWRSEEGVTALSRRVQAVRDLTLAWRVRADASRDERRNRIIWALTIVVGLQGLLAVYDFVTNNLVQVVSQVRLWLGVGFLVIAVLLVLAELRSSLIRQGRWPSGRVRGGD